MTSSDDPDRDRRPTSRPKTNPLRPKIKARVTSNWSRAARREYSAPGVGPSTASPSAAALNAISKRAVRATLEYLHSRHTALEKFAPATALAVDLSFVGDGEIQELNASYRGKNKPTDVLSFAQTEGEVFPGAENLAGEVLLGDVIIAIGVAQRQARELRHSLEREIAFLTVHGVLHLCGFDHDTSSRRAAMWKLQDAVVESLFDSSLSCSSR
jgi:probable rRNA maturation factor